MKKRNLTLGGLLLATLTAMSAAPALASTSRNAHPEAVVAEGGDAVELRRRSYTYEKAKIVRMVMQKSNRMKLWINRGDNKKIYEGSTGVLYRGNSKRFLKDIDGKTVRFRVTKVRDRGCEAIIYQGRIGFDTVRANRRVVLRRRR